MKNLTDSNADLAKSVRDLKDSNLELSGYVNKLALAAHVSSDMPLSNIVQGIIERLPKRVENIATVKGDKNTTSVGQSGGITTGTNQGIITSNQRGGTNVVVPEKPARVFDAAMAQEILRQLPDQSHVIDVQFIMGPGTAERGPLANRIVNYLTSKGYTMKETPAGGLMTPDSYVGITVQPPDANGVAHIIVGENKGLQMSRGPR